ncbi:tail fiber assembly protein [Erwinia sp. CPCC 100877]|nr:tail fiber assembly protein [Erwinia sp. CPCC 100877]
MIEIKNIRAVEPTTPEQIDLVKSNNITLLFSEDGRDWYKYQSLFLPETLKIAYDSNNVIRAISQDVSAINPEGMSVTEFYSLPDGCDINGGWQCVNREVSIIPEYKSMQAEKKKIELLRNVSVNILPLQDAVDFNIATEQEQQQLTAWKKYRVLLNRVDTSKAPDIEWPQAPDL